MVTALVFLLILTVSVLVHEAAHYLNAKSVGLPVRAFSVGMGPVIYRRRWRETEWRISLLPLGGYVDLPGLAAETDESGKLHTPSEGFVTLNLWQKLWVLAGGVIANFILAIVLLAVVITAQPSFRAVTAGITPQESGAVFAEVSPNSPAEAYGIEPGDVVLEINGIDNPSIAQIQQVIREANELNLVLQRNGSTVTVEQPWPPEGVDGTPLLGVGLEPLEVEELPRISFGAALIEATVFSARVVPTTVQAFTSAVGQTFTGQRSEDVAGPVGIYRSIGEATRVGIVPLLAITALINLSLAVFNLLPIPGLDGGRMLLSTVVAIRGKPFRPGQEEFIHFLGFMAIIAFILLVTFGEVGDLVRGG